MCTFDFYPHQMPKWIKIVARILGVFVGLFLVSVLSFILFLMVTEFSPVSKSKAVIDGTGKSKEPSRCEYSLMTWNIGYAGLGKEMDFFYDGGTMTRPPHWQFLHYFNGIKKVLKAQEEADFILLQEVDVCSKRDWYQDEYTGLSSVMTKQYHGFAQNYECRFVPLPFTDPMGKVKAGLVTFSSIPPYEATIQYYGSDFSWPLRLVMLKRCYMLFRFRLDNGKDLVIMNLHNSAYDSTGVLREKELHVLDSVINRENELGNYVIAGGDWNSNPRGFNVRTIHQGDLVTTIEPPIPGSYLRGWNFVYDSLNPSNRYTDIPYRKGETKTTIIDFFVVSENVEVKNVTTIPMGFEYSDHEPVVMKIRLK